MQGELEARPARRRVAVVLVLGRPHRLEPLGQGLRIAAVAARRHPIAARGRVPRRLGPLDRRLVSHTSTVGTGCDREQSTSGRALQESGLAGEERVGHQAAFTLSDETRRYVLRVCSESPPRGDMGGQS